MSTDRLTEDVTSSIAQPTLDATVSPITLESRVLRFAIPPNPGAALLAQLDRTVKQGLADHALDAVICDAAGAGYLDSATLRVLMHAALRVLRTVRGQAENGDVEWVRFQLRGLTADQRRLFDLAGLRALLDSPEAP